MSVGDLLLSPCAVGGAVSRWSCHCFVFKFAVEYSWIKFAEYPVISLLANSFVVA